MTGLAVAHLSVAYDDQVVLTDATMECRAGEIVGLLGPNGSGKSTLLKAVLGLVPRVRGEVTLDGEPLYSKAATKRHAHDGEIAAPVRQRIGPELLR